MNALCIAVAGALGALSRYGIDAMAASLLGRAFPYGTLIANVSKGGVMIKAANAIGYTAATIGNHEFDFGPLLPGDPDKLGVIKKRVKEAAFPFLALT